MYEEVDRLFSLMSQTANFELTRFAVKQIHVTARNKALLKKTNRTACQEVPYPKKWTSKPSVIFTGARHSSLP